MKIKCWVIIIGAMIGLISGCLSLPGTAKSIDVVLKNNSSTDLDSASVRFGKYQHSSGFLGRTTSAGYGDFGHPITPEADVLWEFGGKKRTERVDLKQLKRTGKYGELIFTITDQGVSAEYKEIALP